MCHSTSLSQHWTAGPIPGPYKAQRSLLTTNPITPLTHTRTHHVCTAQAPSHLLQPHTEPSATPSAPPFLMVMLLNTCPTARQRAGWDTLPQGFYWATERITLRLSITDDSTLGRKETIETRVYLVACERLTSKFSMLGLQIATELKSIPNLSLPLAMCRASR